MSTDTPVSFGYKIAWLAIRSSDGLEVIESLGLKGVQHCSWKTGIEKAYKCEGIFISPPIEGWTVAVGSHPEAGQTEFSPYLERLSAKFGDICYFGTHRVVEYQAWAKASNGTLQRAFGYLGERGEFLVNIGDRTVEEISIGTGIEDLENSPSEETVLELAAKWVFDPRELDTYPPQNNQGWFGSR